MIASVVLCQRKGLEVRRHGPDHRCGSNVREDGTIPQFEPKSWEGLNTFRTNAQIEGGGLCEPDPQG